MIIDGDTDKDEDEQAKNEKTKNKLDFYSFKKKASFTFADARKKTYQENIEKTIHKLDDFGNYLIKTMNGLDWEFYDDKNMSTDKTYDLFDDLPYTPDFIEEPDIKKILVESYTKFQETGEFQTRYNFILASRSLRKYLIFSISTFIDGEVNMVELIFFSRLFNTQLILPMTKPESDFKELAMNINQIVEHYEKVIVISEEGGSSSHFTFNSLLKIVDPKDLFCVKDEKLKKLRKIKPLCVKSEINKSEINKSEIDESERDKDECKENLKKLGDKFEKILDAHPTAKGEHLYDIVFESFEKIDLYVDKGLTKSCSNEQNPDWRLAITLSRKIFENNKPGFRLKSFGKVNKSEKSMTSVQYDIYEDYPNDFSTILEDYITKLIDLVFTR